MPSIGMRIPSFMAHFPIRLSSDTSMEYLHQFFIRNFFLLCLSFGVIFMVLRSYRAKKVAVLMPICIVSATLAIAIAYTLEQFAVKNPQHVFLGTFCFVFGMSVRPLILYFFLRMTVQRHLIKRIALGMVIGNAIVYCFALFRVAPDFAKIVFWYDDTGAQLVYHWGPLYFFSYGVVAVMAIYLVVVSILALKGRHRYDALASLICVVFILIAILLETLDPSLVDYSLLNTTTAIACLFYVVHLYQQAANRDGLTGLFDRKTYYVDVEKLGNRVLGVILIDMNSLKQLNDTQGHAAGDVAIVTIARTLEKCTSKRSMYIYRMGGDEFLVLSTSTKPNAVEKASQAILDEMAKTPYSVSLGYKLRGDYTGHTRDLIRQAEDIMYANKAEYYRNGHQRRSTDSI